MIASTVWPDDHKLVQGQIQLRGSRATHPSYYSALVYAAAKDLYAQDRKLNA